MEQYFCLELYDYANPAFVTCSKPYFGTIRQIADFVSVLEQSEKNKKQFARLREAFYAYQAGNHQVTYAIDYLEEHPFLESVQVLGEQVVKQENFRWTHQNIHFCPYEMRCKEVISHHLWLERGENFYRSIKASFLDLEIKDDFTGKWEAHPSPENFWGHPGVIHVDRGRLTNILYEPEERFHSRQEMLEDMKAFQNAPSPDFSEFCNDIFGDG